jgi:hypothetical protein
MPNHTPRLDLLSIVTPLLWDKWEELLDAAGVLDRFHDVPLGLRDGFHLGVSSSISVTFSPPNHNLALEHADFVNSQIEKELAAGRYSIGYNPAEFERLFSPYCMAPLGVVVTPKKKCLIQDHSFPRHDPLMHSINSEIDSNAFKCDWGTFAQCYLLVAHAPPGSQAAIFNVDSAHCCMPVAPEDHHHVCIAWNGKAYADHCCCFGCSSSSSIFGHCADAIVAIFCFKSIQDIIKWADDFLFFHYPKERLPSGEYIFPYDASLIWSIAKYLGWPWSPEKFRDFLSLFVYIGFEWNLGAKTVCIPQDKKKKYLEHLEGWVAGAKVSAHDCAVLTGTLNHCSAVVITGRSHLASLYCFASKFAVSSSRFELCSIPDSVVINVSWWWNQLSSAWCGLPIVIPPSAHPVPIFVDASTSFGIGFWWDGRWLAWCLLEGWQADGRDIGWAEMVAIELGLHCVIAAGFRNARFILHSDNQGVVGGFRAGMSRNSEQNSILCCIIFLFQEHSLWFSTIWVLSAENLADAPSRGIFHHGGKCFSHCPRIPFHLRKFVSLHQ